MAYDIPDEIKYREKIFLHFDIKQLGYLVAFLILAGLAYSLPIMQEGKMILAFLLLLLGLGFALFDLERKLLDRWRYLTNPRLGGALDKKIRAFVGIKKIEDDVIYLDNKEMRAVILVKPLNFELLDEAKQKSITLNYRDFLNQLSHPIQILIRTVNVSLADYFSNHEAKILKTKDESLIALYNDFKVYEEGFIKEHFVKERLYYIVIPYDPAASQYAKHRTTYKKVGYSEKRKDAQLREFDERVKIIQTKLGNCGLVSYRLTTNQLISLIMSYFEGYIEVNEDYLWRISTCELFLKERERDG
ncbi:hypothetical protein HY990_00230 [Candidatus Micrarchaeota archaeon]|nr:hypothetical protein [Candidatus Micrarchaeota archaeon]